MFLIFVRRALRPRDGVNQIRGYFVRPGLHISNFEECLIRFQTPVVLRVGGLAIPNDSWWDPVTKSTDTAHAGALQTGKRSATDIPVYNRYRLNRHQCRRRVLVLIQNNRASHLFTQFIHIRTGWRRLEPRKECSRNATGIISLMGWERWGLWD